MKDKWLSLDRAGKIRLIILALICAWCTYGVIAYTHEIYNLSIADKMIDTKHMGSIYIDGSNFTGFFKLLGTGANGLVVLAIYGVYSLAMIVISLIPEFLYWLIVVRKAEGVSPDEAELAKNFCGIGGFISLIGGLLITGFSTRMPAVLFTLIWLLPAFLIIVVPIRKRIETERPNGGN